MIKKILTYYKVPLLISLTLGITILAMSVARSALEIAEVFIGVILGTFLLDTEYILYSYIFEPKTDFAKSIFAYIKSSDFGGLISFINEHKNEVKDKSFNSVLFQAILIFVVVFVSYIDTSYLIKAFVMSIFANSIYKLIECVFEGTTKEWFWAIKGTPKKDAVVVFIIGLVIVLAISLYFV
jgi:hypothetical protein